MKQISRVPSRVFVSNKYKSVNRDNKLTSITTITKGVLILIIADLFIVTKYGTNYRQVSMPKYHNIITKLHLRWLAAELDSAIRHENVIYIAYAKCSVKYKAVNRDVP